MTNRGKYVHVFATHVHMTPVRASKLLKKGGNNCIYTRSGLMFPNPSSEDLRKYAHQFGYVVFVDQYGQIWPYTSKMFGTKPNPAKKYKIEAQRARMEAKEEMRRHENEIAAIEEDIRREKVFASGQTYGSKKRQGKADSLDDIGMYRNNGRPRSLNDRGRAMKTADYKNNKLVNVEYRN